VVVFSRSGPIVRASKAYINACRRPAGCATSSPPAGLKISQPGHSADPRRRPERRGTAARRVGDGAPQGGGTIGQGAVAQGWWAEASSSRIGGETQARADATAGQKRPRKAWPADQGKKLQRLIGLERCAHWLQDPIPLPVTRRGVWIPCAAWTATGQMAQFDDWLFFDQSCREVSVFAPLHWARPTLSLASPRRWTSCACCRKQADWPSCAGSSGGPRGAAGAVPHLMHALAACSRLPHCLRLATDLGCDSHEERAACRLGKRPSSSRQASCFCSSNCGRYGGMPPRGETVGMPF